MFFISSASVKANEPWQDTGVNTNAFTNRLTQPFTTVWHHLMTQTLERPAASAVIGKGVRTRTGGSPDKWAANTIALPKGSVISFGEQTEATSLHVFRGTLWLTETPGTQDYVLEEGEEHALGHQWPVVVQALEDSVIMVS